MEKMNISKIGIVFLAIILMMPLMFTSIVSAETACEQWELCLEGASAAACAESYCPECCIEICSIVDPFGLTKCTETCLSACLQEMTPCIDFDRGSPLLLQQGECSPNKPKYCYMGKLIDNCQKCSPCPSGLECFADGKCKRYCPDGSPNAGTPYIPKPEKKGCCNYTEECREGNDPEECRVCYGGKWRSGGYCKDDKCIPEFQTIAAPVAAIFGLLLLIRRRRKQKG